MNIEEFFKGLKLNKQKRVLLFLILGTQIISIWSLTTLVPFQDYYDWIYQSNILFEIWNGNTIAETHFELTSFWEFPPNGFVTFFLAILQFFVSADIAGKILLTLIVLLFNLGGYRLVTSLYPESPFRFLALLFPFHFFFYKGFLSYCLGLAILFNLIAFLSQKRNWLLLSGSFFFFISSLFVFSIHGFIYGVYIFSILVWLIHPSNKEIKSLTKVFYVASLIQSIILLILYIFSSSGSTESFAVLYNSPIHWAQVLRYGSHFFSRISMNPTWIPLSILNLGLLLFPLIIFLKYRAQFESKSYVFILFASFLAMMILNPFYQIGLFFPLSSRLTLLLVLIFASLFKFKKQIPSLEYVLLTVALLFSASHFIHLKTFDQSNKELLQSLAEVVEGEEAVFIIGKTFPSDLEKSLHTVFSGTTDPYIFLNSALNIEHLDSPQYFQETGVIKTKSDKAFERSFLGSLLFDTPDLESALVNVAEYQSSFSKEFEFIILLGSTETKTKFANAFSPNFKLEESTEEYLILRRQ